MSGFVIWSHLLTDTIHGGYEDAASVTLWLDEAASVAHLTGHSGSYVPLDGPVAPRDVPVFEKTGKTGYIAEFDALSIEGLQETLQELLAGWQVGGDNEELGEQITDALDDFLDADVSYRDWTAENEPETHESLYGEDMSA